MRDFGADAAFVAAELDDKLAEILGGRARRSTIPFGREPALDAAVARLLGRLRVAERRGTRAPVRLVDARADAARDAPHQVAAGGRDPAPRRRDHRRGAHRARCCARATRRASTRSRRWSTTRSARTAAPGPGYPTIVGGGANATILHYVENRAPLVRGQLLLIDAGCEIDGYTADVTRTSPIGARFSPAQRRLYEAVLETQIAAIEAVKPGATLDAIHKQVVEQLTRHMVALGLLTGDVPALVEAGAFQAFYMHRTSHWLGMDVHDVGFYSEGGAARPLSPGMVLTIEPGLYVAADAPVPPEYRGLGVRIEDDILVTADGYENLTVVDAEVGRRHRSADRVAAPAALTSEGASELEDEAAAEVEHGVGVAALERAVVAEAAERVADLAAHAQPVEEEVVGAAHDAEREAARGGRAVRKREHEPRRPRPCTGPAASASRTST